MKALLLTEKERKQLRGVLYGVRVGGCMREEDFALLADIEKRLAPSRMTMVPSSKVSHEP